MSSIVEQSLRPATCDDLAAVQEIVRAAYTRYAARIGGKPGPIFDNDAALIDEGRVHVGNRDGILQGLLVLVPKDDAMLLDNIVLAPEAQGSGLGNDGKHRTLTDIGYTAMRWIEGKGLQRIYTRKPLGENSLQL